jgi:hypothetical protein
MHFATRVRTAYKHNGHFWRCAAFFTILLQCHYQQSQLPTDFSQRFACGTEWEYWAPNPNTVHWNSSISEAVRNMTHVHIYIFCVEWPMLWRPRIPTFSLGHSIFNNGRTGTRYLSTGRGKEGISLVSIGYSLACNTMSLVYIVAASRAPLCP